MNSFSQYIDRIAVGGLTTGLAVILTITTVSKDQYDAALGLAVLWAGWMVITATVTLAAAYGYDAKEARNNWRANTVAMVGLISSVATMLIALGMFYELLSHFAVAKAHIFAMEATLVIAALLCIFL